MYTVLREYIRYNSPGAKSKLLRWPEETCKLGRLASSATWRMAAASCAMAGPCKPPPNSWVKLRAKKMPPWVVFPPDAKPARNECNRRGLFSTGGCHVNKMALKILCVLSKTRQQKWALFRSIRISSAHRRTRALRLICSCPYSLTSITHGDSSHTPQYKHFTVSSEI